MTKVYLVRHCESLGNLRQVIQGSSDLDISECGAHQLTCLRRRFDNVHLDAIYSSPLTRAYKTAQAVRGDKQIEIIKDPRLREMDFGCIEQKSRAWFVENYPSEYDTFINSFSKLVTPDGESTAEVYDRVSEAFFELVQKNKGKTFAIASHGGALRTLLARLMYECTDGIDKLKFMRNTAVCEVNIGDDGRVDVLYIDDVSHLDNESVTAICV